MPLLEMALDLGADINNVSNAGKSVLLFACEQATDCENICLRLLEKGADPNIADPVCLHTLFMLLRFGLIFKKTC